MALSSVSPIVLPCSSRTPRQRMFQTRHRQHSQAIRNLQFLTNLTQCTSPHPVRGRQRALSKSTIRAESSENSEENENSRVGVRNEASNYAARRTYRKALASLRVTGEALPLQVNAALAADGGRTAAQELAKGKPMLVIETYNPGRFSEGSSVSTKLQAPTLSVLKRAKSMPKHESQFSLSGRAFAIAFQAVRMLKLSKFELCFFKPGTMKGMEDYKEGEIIGFLEVFDVSTLSEIAKSVCSYALACVKDHADQKLNVQGFGSRLFQNPQKVKLTTIVDSPAVRISTLTESEVLAHVETIVEEKSLVGASMGLRRHRSWWERPLATQAVVTTGVDAQLVDEFVPAHALEFKLPSNNFEAVGLQKTDENSCRIHLTHAQMMDLADVLDLYCGDPYTGSGENVSISINIPRRSWTRAVAVGALASVVGGALVLGFLSFRRARSQMDTPPPALESIFDMAFSQKLRELREGEPVDEQTDPIDEQTDPVDEQMEPVDEQSGAVAEPSVHDDVVLAEQNEVIDEPVYKSPSRVSFRGRTRYYN